MVNLATAKINTFLLLATAMASPPEEFKTINTRKNIGAISMLGLVVDIYSCAVH